MDVAVHAQAVAPGLVLAFVCPHHVGPEDVVLRVGVGVGLQAAEGLMVTAMADPSSTVSEERLTATDGDDWAWAWVA